MPRQAGPERKHFGGESGLHEVIVNGKSKYHWVCNYCGWRLGGKNFQNSKARVHLSGDPTLRNGMIAKVCTRAPDHIKDKFASSERASRKEKKSEQQKRKRASELLNELQPIPTSQRNKQSRLNLQMSSSAVDEAWGEAFYGLDIPIRKIDQPLFRTALQATKRSKNKLVLVYINYRCIVDYFMYMMHMQV